MAGFARSSLAWLGSLALALASCFADPPMVTEDDSTGPDPDPGTSAATPTTTDLTTTTTDPTTSASTSTGPDPDSSGTTSTTTPPDSSSGSSTGPDPMECRAPDGQPDAACPLATPFCVAGSCVPCSAGGDCSALDPLTPICDDNDVCQPCVEHGQCPGDAGCHLFEGSCLPADRVYWVDPDGMCGPAATQAMPACSIAQGLLAAVGEPQVTIQLAENVYLEDFTVPAGRVIAFIGTGPVTVVTSGGDPTVTVQGTAYLSGIDVQNFDVSGTGVESSGDLWLDDSMVRNNDTGLHSSAGRVVLRRSRVTDSVTLGVLLAGPEPAVFVNTIVAGNGDDPFDPAAAGIVSTAAGPIDVLYSTIVQNMGASGSAIDCGTGIATVRNSIVAAPMLTDAVACPAGTTVTYSVVTDAEFEGDPTNLTLMNFGNLMMDMNYEIAAGSVANDVAQWELGDPLTDIHGDLRPAVAGSPDYAGADLP